MNESKYMTTAVASIMAATAVFAAEPAVKVLSPPEDATQNTVLIGRTVADKMIVSLEIEGAERMWMPMGDPPRWMEEKADKGELFHVEVKPIDPGSKTRISYANVTFSAVNRDNKKRVSGTLHPSWGDSGLHYAYNTALAGDGSYDVTVTVGVPSFGRTSKNRNLWTKPVTTKFHFKLVGKKLVEVTTPMPDPN